MRRTLRWAGLIFPHEEMNQNASADVRGLGEEKQGDLVSSHPSQNEVCYSSLGRGLACLLGVKNATH